jgi:hypothetical protein
MAYGTSNSSAADIHFNFGNYANNIAYYIDGMSVSAGEFNMFFNFEMRSGGFGSGTAELDGGGRGYSEYATALQDYQASQKLYQIQQGFYNSSSSHNIVNGTHIRESWGLIGWVYYQFTNKHIGIGYIIPNKIYAPFAPSAYTYYMYGHDDPPGSNLSEHAKFLGESGEKYFVLTGEAFHNELYWVQKNGTIRLTSNIGNNYLFKRSYNLVGQSAETSKIIAKGLWRANMYYAAYDYSMDAFRTGSIPSLGKGTDLFFTSVAAIPVWGWAASGGYWLTSMGFYLSTGKTLGEHIDIWYSGK